MALIYQDPPGAGGVEAARLRLNVPRRVWVLAISAGVGWALLNASVIVVASFAPSFLMSRGASVSHAGLITGAALWISIVSVPLGGLVADRVNRPKLLIVDRLPGGRGQHDRHRLRPHARAVDGGRPASCSACRPAS